MLSFSLGRLSPIRSFPAYAGPYAVGSCDVELAAEDLDSPQKSCPDESIGTVSFRIFYPCEPNQSQRPVRWVPSPQPRYGAAYARFLGATPTIADVISYFPQFLYMTRIPVHRNAKLLSPCTSSKKWPVLVFSHGLAGSRNAYSHICGSLASHGIIVIAPDHRDGSEPISFVRETSTTPAKEIHYKRYSHTPSPEVFKARDDQLRIRLWELGLIHDALLKIETGQHLNNLDPNDGEKRGKRTEVLDMFVDKLDVKRPGAIVWSGHSFGATTVTQFVKHTYYGPPSEEDARDLNLSDQGQVEQVPLFNPARDSEIVKQITSSSVMHLLDMWCLPLRSRATRWLWNKPMPCYNGPVGGEAIVAILSAKFFDWEGNMNDMKRALSPSATSDSCLQRRPYFFYPDASAHLSQSDFGILFPLVTGRFLKTKEPERLLRLNARAMLQVMRQNGIEVAAPSEIDWDDREDTMFASGVNSSNVSVSSSDSVGVSSMGASSVAMEKKENRLQDFAILDSFGGKVRGWNPISLDGAGQKSVEEDTSSGVDEGDDVGVMEELQGAASHAM